MEPIPPRERITPGGAVIIATCEAVRADKDGNQVALWVERCGSTVLWRRVKRTFKDGRELDAPDIPANKFLEMFP